MQGLIAIIICTLDKMLCVGDRQASADHETTNGCIIVFRFMNAIKTSRPRMYSAVLIFIPESFFFFFCIHYAYTCQ